MSDKTISNERLGVIASSGTNCFKQAIPAEAEIIARELLEAREQLAMLSDPAKVHTNILRGTIALTKAQAIHIAGLPADVEEQLQQLRASHEELVKALEYVIEVREITCLHKHPEPDGICAKCKADAALESVRKVDG